MAVNLPTHTSSHLTHPIPSSAPPLTEGVDAKISAIRAKVLETMRLHIPIMTVFTPELKIDLNLFIKDQILIHKIAVFLASLEANGSMDSEAIAKHFEKSDLFSEVKGLFSKDLDAYMSLFYKACLDVLNNHVFSGHLKPAIEGRIYTLKNALYAQHNPEAIQASQKQCLTTPYEISKIKEEGASFIRELLHIHLKALKQAESSSFKDLLISTSEQLIPFVQRMATSYLREQGKACPGNPLTFRNPTGYNFHGHMAAIIMEPCLNALGYATRIMNRCDLEPKVTLATTHNLIEVTAPDQTKYLVDPCYMQFHKDICIEDEKLPTSPVLVLSEAEVNQYVEDNLMVHWKAHAKRIKEGDDSLIKKLTESDQLLSFQMQELPYPKELVPANLESWVRNALRKVWNIRSYNHIQSDEGFQEIFIGSTKDHATYDSIKAMNIASLSYHRPISDIEMRLKEISRDPKLKGQNSVEALSLVAQLPTDKKAAYNSLLDADPRIDANKGGIGVTVNAYFRSLKKVVNPDGKDLKVIYGCAGADCASVMLATDAKEFTFMDLTNFTFHDFEKALEYLKSLNGMSESVLLQQLEKSYQFVSVRRRWGGASSSYLEGKHEMEHLALKLLFDLRSIGVDLNKVILTSIQKGKGVCLEFPWQYHGSSSSRNRTLTYLTGDITKPETYPTHLKTKLAEGFDIFYMKAAFLAPRYYPDFLPHLAKAIKAEGWLMTVDKTFMMEEMDPGLCLKENGLTFVPHKSSEAKVIEAMMQPHFDGLGTIQQLINNRDNRYARMPGSDLTYWAILNLRKKIPVEIEKYEANSLSQEAT